MEKRDLLNQYVEAIVKKDSDAADAAFKQFVTAKASDLVAEIRAKKEFSDKLNEVFGDGAIQFNGDDVIVNGKVVGQVKTDLSEMDSAIDFISADGKFSKEFVDIESLYAYIAKTFGVKENSMTGNLGTKIETPKELDVGDAKEPELPSGDGAADLKGKTKGEFKPDGETAQGETARAKKIKGLIATIKGGGRATSSTVTENGEWTLKNSDIDVGKEGKLKSNIKKMKKKADASGNTK